MKVILYMAMSVNGFIARENHDTSFVSESEWARFREMLQRVGNMIVGRRTYEIMVEHNELVGLETIRIVIVSTKNDFKPAYPRHVVMRSPHEALDLLKQEGHAEVIISGGGKLNASFMSEGLIDEVHLNIEPVVFGKGMALFVGKDFFTSLHFIDSRRFGSHGVQLRYKVVKE